VDRKRPFGSEPEQERQRQGDRERNRRIQQPNMEIVDQIVGDQRANDADQHHGQPVGGGNIFLLRKLPDQGERQNCGHDQ